MTASSGARGAPATGGFYPRLYDLVLAPAERGGLSRLRRWLVGSVRGRVLEIGAGTGLNFPHYGPEARVVAIDPDLSMLARARERAAVTRADVMLVVADAAALPFRDGVFDAAIVGLAMCTIPHPQRALEQTRRALRPGGEARLLEHVRVDTPVAGRLQDWLTPLWQRAAGGCHLNRDTVRSVARSGFKLEEVRSHAGGYVVGITALAPAGGTPADARGRAP